MLRTRYKDEEYYSDTSDEEADKVLLVMEPDHDEHRSNENPCDTVTLSAEKTAKRCDTATLSLNSLAS